MYYAGNTLVYHNNLINNLEQVIETPGCTNAWDNGYPSGGNYWSDYIGIDSNHDGIGDTSYTIDPNNIDNYPLMHPYGSVQNLNTSLVYLNIQSAIDAPETLDGHTIFVRNGTYYENVVVNRQVRLLGENRIGTIIDANAAGTVLNIVTSNVGVSGFTIKGGGSTSPDSGVLLQGAREL